MPQRSEDLRKWFWALIRSVNCAIIRHLGVQVMMKLIDGKSSIFNSLDSNYATWGLHMGNSRHAPAEEPLRVQVRVRQYADAAPESRQVHSPSLDPGRLPVGTVLDCYV